MTQEDLANELFVSRQLISKWENGKSYPDLEQLLTLSNFFDLTLDELMRGDKKMTKNLNTAIKRKTLFTAIIGVLVIALALLTYFFWTSGSVQLKPEDIEILSIKTETNPSEEVTNSDTGKKVTLPPDVSYTITYKIKKPFTKIQTGYYLGQDNENLYLDFRGQHTLFDTSEEYTFRISSDYQLYKNASLELDINYIPKTIEDKNIKIFEVSNDFNGENFSSMNSWLLIPKVDLNTK